MIELRKEYDGASGAMKGEILALLLRCGAPGLAAELKSFRTESDADLRMKIAYAARRSRDPSLTPELSVWLKEDLDPFVREYAALSLGEIGDEAASPALKEALGKEGQDPYVKAAAQVALRKIEEGKKSAASAAGNPVLGPSPPEPPVPAPPLASTPP